MPTYPPIGLTGITGLQGTTTLSGPATPGVTTVKIVHTRDPVLPLFAQIPPTQAPNQVYQVLYRWSGSQSAVGTVTSNTHALAGIDDVLLVVNGTTDSPNTRVTNAAPSLYSAMGGNFAPMMRDSTLGGLPFIYVPQGYSLTATCSVNGITASTGLGEFTLVYEEWVSAGQTDATTVVFAPPVGQSQFVPSVAAAYGYPIVTATTSTWVRPTNVNLAVAGSGGLSIAGGAIGDLTLTVAAGTMSYAASSWPASYTIMGVAADQVIAVPAVLPAAHQVATPVMLSELLAHSSHLTLENVTQVMSKEGSIQAARYNLSLQNPWSVVYDAGFQGQDPRKRYVGGAEHGVRSIVEPGTHFGATRLHQLHTFYTNTINVPVANFMVGDYVNVIFIYDPSPATPGQFLCSLWTGWEYVTPYSTLPLAVARGLSTDVERALQQMATQCPFSRFERNGAVLATTAGRSVRAPRQKATSRPRPRPRSSTQPAQQTQLVRRARSRSRSLTNRLPPTGFLPRTRRGTRPSTRASSRTRRGTAVTLPPRVR